MKDEKCTSRKAVCAVFGALAVVALVVLVRECPALARYLKMTRM
ncbi:hypothetical protein [Saccharopolyspora oryzae]|uniref:Uncharacterized protein n=1 Tax=Saccharopolyspora oryzae TaxID=2997343 RepID=A0ABT4UU10_9PSEU|nr:hypothetical protein [Saccharopolyspora oryzae]MDA3625211.1 hypothetical protein [Saccharopolyspora oryzae]